MKDAPLIFTLQNMVSGGDFTAGVLAVGRVLCTKEDNACWFHGVAPGGLSASGDNPQGAWLAFMNSFQEALFDLASDAASYEEFATRVRGFFHDVDRVDEARWREAAQFYRDGKGKIPSPFDRLDRKLLEQEIDIQVVRLDKKTNHPQMVNTVHELALAEVA